MKCFCAAVVVSLFTLLAGCATSIPVGALYTDVTLPVDATGNTRGSKVGTAQCQSILTLLSTGDCSMEAAMENGSISTVSHTDWKANNILGVIGNYTLTVYGE